MKARSKTNMADRTGWIGQARIHTDHCPHGNWFSPSPGTVHISTSLNRFAARLRHSNSRSPDWDWTTHPTIPSVFWGGNDNPLDHQSNNPNFPGPHNGREIGPTCAMPDEFVGQAVIQSILGNSGFRSSIGSDPAPEPRPNDDIDRAQSTLEGTPHNNVHGIINGDMGSPPTAARSNFLVTSLQHRPHLDAVGRQIPAGFSRRAPGTATTA